MATVSFYKQILKTLTKNMNTCNPKTIRVIFNYDTTIILYNSFLELYLKIIDYKI